MSRPLLRNLLPFVATAAMLATAWHALPAAIATRFTPDGAPAASSAKGAVVLVLLATQLGLLAGAAPLGAAFARLARSRWLLSKLPYGELWDQPEHHARLEAAARRDAATLLSIAGFGIAGWTWLLVEANASAPPELDLRIRQALIVGAGAAAFGRVMYRCFRLFLGPLA